MGKKEKAPCLRFKDTNGKDYPAWEQRKLGELAATFGYGLNAAAKSFDGRHKYIRITDIDESTRRFLCSSLTSPDIDFEEAAPYRLAEGDVLFARTGASVGKSYRYVRTDGEVYFAGFLIRFRFKDKEAAEFVFQNSLTAKFQNFIKTSSQRSGQPGINAQQFSGYQIAVPNSEERERIGSFFSRLDTAITLHQRKLETLKKLKRTLLQKMFPKKGQLKPELRFPGFTNDWEQRKLEDCAAIIMGQSPKSENYTNDPKDHVLVQGNADLKNGQVVPRVWTTEVTKVGKVGDIILSVRAPVGEVGKTAFDVVLGRGVAAIRGNDFLLQTLQKFKECKYWGRVSAGSTFDSITSEILKSTVISMPTIEEQIKIGDFLSSVDNLITLHQRKLETYKKLKKSLLQKMFI